MIKKLIIAIMALMLFAPQAALAQKVRVLVMDEGFRRIPEKDEKPELLGGLPGELIVGMSDYRGEIEVWRGKNGLYLINELPLEDYVEGVVKAETADDWEEEALKAQAVIVRTYVLKEMMKKREGIYHVTSSVMHQVYKGLNTDPKVTKAVRETRGQVLTYGGEPIMAFYHSTGGGKTELPEAVFGQSYPYLKSVEAEGKLSPLNVWARRIPLKDIEEAVGVAHLKDITVSSRTATGRADEVTLVANPETVTLKAQELRKLLGWRRLPSTNFTLSVKDGYADFEGSGYGHGVGLCQWTALEMAREGMAYKEILSYFYPGTELVNDTFGF
jgi:stage II sporulation protein D